MTSIPFKNETIRLLFNLITVLHYASSAFINASEFTCADAFLGNETTTRKLFVTKDTRREYDFLYSDQSCEFLTKTRAPFSREVQLKQILATFDSEDGGMVIDSPKRSSSELRAPTLPESMFDDFQCESIDSDDKESKKSDLETQKEGMFSSRQDSSDSHLVRMTKGRKYDLLNDVNIKTQLQNSTDKSVDTDALKNVFKLFGSDERLVVAGNKSVERYEGKEPTLPAMMFDSELQVSHIRQSDEAEPHSGFQRQHSKIEYSDATVDRTEEESKETDTQSESHIFDISSLLNHRKPPLRTPISNEHHLKDVKSHYQTFTSNTPTFNEYSIETIIRTTTTYELYTLVRKTTAKKKKGAHTMQPKTQSIDVSFEKTFKNNNFKQKTTKAIKRKKLTKNAEIQSTKRKGRPRKTTEFLISSNMKTKPQQPADFGKTIKDNEKTINDIEKETIEVSAIQPSQAQDEVKNQRAHIYDKFIFKEKNHYSLHTKVLLRRILNTPTDELLEINNFNKKRMLNATIFCTLGDSDETGDLSGFTVVPILDSNMFHDLDEYIATRRKTKTTTKSLKPLKNFDDRLQHIKELCSGYGKLLVSKNESRIHVLSCHPEETNGTVIENKCDVNETSKAEVEEVPIIDFQDPFRIIEHKRRQSQHPWNFKIGSWNVNGIRAWSQKNGFSFLRDHDLDVFCVQEVRCPQEKIPPCPAGYHSFWFPGTKQGYAGVAVLTKLRPLSVAEGFLSDHEDDIDDGRVLTVEFERFYLTNVYAPASKQDLSMLPLKLRWNSLLRRHVVKLNATKPVVVAGDLNVAHQPIDVALPLTNSGKSGFTPQERDDFTQLLALGFIDSYRHLYPDRHSFTYWPYYERPAKPNGWRLDYFLISSQLESRLSDQEIHSDQEGSDHSPLILYLNI